MKGLEEENAKLRASLKSGLNDLAAIDPKEQEQILEIARRTGQELPDADLVKKFAREEDLALPLFQHAQSNEKPSTGAADASDPAEEVGEASSSATLGVRSPRGEPAPAAAGAAAAATGGVAVLDPVQPAADAAR